MIRDVFLYRWFLGAAAAACCCQTAQADIPVPPEKPAQDAVTVPLEIRINPRESESRLQIPRKLLGNSAPAANESGAAKSNTRTILAGVAMSLAVVGLFFVRRGNRAVRAAVAVTIVGAALLAAMSTAEANRAPPDVPAAGEANAPPNVPGAAFPPADIVPAAARRKLPTSNGKVVVEVTPDGDHIVLILAGPTAARIAEQNRSGPNAYAPKGEENRAPPVALPPPIE